MTMSYHSLKETCEIKGFHDAAYKVHKGTKASFNTYEKLFVKFQAQYGKDAEKISGSLKGLKYSVESLQASALRSEISSLKQDTSEIKSMMTEIFKAFKEPPSHIEGENDDMETQKTEVEKEPEKETTKEVPTRPTRAVPISTVSPITRPNPEVALIESSSRPPLTDIILEILIPQPIGPVIDITLPEQPKSPPVVPKADKGKGVAIEEIEEPIMKLMLASKEVSQDPNEPIRVPYEIHGKVYQLINDEIQAHMDKEEKIKKAAKEAKLLVMSKPELIKVVQEEATKVGVDLKILESAKSGQEFKKI
ncbi:hypothetical protein Tco_1013096 [Tanacetum coccineum]